MALKFVGVKPKPPVPEAPAQSVAQEQVEAPKAAAKKTAAKKTAPVVAQVEEPVEGGLFEQGTASIVDAYVSLEAKIAPVAPAIKEQAKLKKSLQLKADEIGDPTMVVKFNGTDGGAVIFSEKCDQTVIKEGKKKDLIGAIKEKVGYLGLIDLIELPMGTLQKVMSEEELAPFIEKTTATGPRKVKGVVLP